MRAYEIRGSFGLENLTLTERPSLEPGAGQVVVGLRAASINYRDLMMIRGTYNPRQKLPLIPVSDGVGDVLRLGAGVTRVKVGDRVIAHFMQGWQSGTPTREKISTSLGGPLDGCLAEEILVREEGVTRAPASLSDDEAATLPCAAVTAWSALIGQGRLKAGETVLVQGTGGVSLFALQIARMHGARVIVTSSSDEKLVRAKALGAHDGINYKANPEWGVAARKLTDNVGVDHVVEVGGAGTFDQSVRATRPGGTISLIGVLAGGATQVNLVPVLMQNIRVQGVLVGTGEMLGDLLAAMATSPTVKPVIDKVFPFEEARAAFGHLEGGKHFGKIVIRIRA